MQYKGPGLQREYRPFFYIHLTLRSGSFGDRHIGLSLRWARRRPRWAERAEAHVRDNAQGADGF